MAEDPTRSGSTASLDVPEEDGQNGAPPELEVPPALTPPRRRGGARRSLPDVLVELEFITAERMQEVLTLASQAGRSAEEILREEGELSSEQLARATAERFGLDYVDMNVFKPD